MKKHEPESDRSERRLKGRRQEDDAALDCRDLIDGAVQGIFIHSNFKPLYANAAFAKLFGYDSVEEILAIPLARCLFSSDVWPEVERDYDELIHGVQKPHIIRRRALKKDGSEIWISITERPVHWRGLKAMQICAFDITDHVVKEQKLIGNEQFLSSILQILPVPVYIARRRDGKIQFVNRKTCLLLQLSAGPLLKSFSQDYFVDPQELERIYMLLDAVHDVREIEARARSAQGREFTAEIAAITMVYDGEPSILVAMNDISQRKQLENELFHQANTDSLTGLSNRRHFMVEAEQEIRRARRFERELSVIMMDLDHFKRINDTLGHATGDAVLENIVRASLESLRESDIMGRLGGEEFAILLPETGLDAAMEVAGRLLTHIAETQVPTAKGVVRCTTSLGVAHLVPADNSIDDLLHRADDALYRAKDKGRNRAELAE